MPRSKYHPFESELQQWNAYTQHKQAVLDNLKAQGFAPSKGNTYTYKQWIKSVRRGNVKW